MKYRLALRFILRHKFTRDEKRNIRLGLVVSIYGFLFALEKAFIVFWHPLSDGFWFVTYGICALLSFVWWLEDSIFDAWEHHTTEDDELYGHG